MTAVPVVVGMSGATIYAGASRLIPFVRIAPTFVTQPALLLLFLGASCRARSAPASSGEND